MSKKIISVLLSAVCILSSFFTANIIGLAAGFDTLQESVLGVDSYASISRYPEFMNKLGDVSFTIPGLTSTISVDKSTGEYRAIKSMVPQGMCSVGSYTLITAYDIDENCKSVIYVLDADNALVKTLILPDSNHVGGIAYDKNNQLILITKASKKAVGVISLADFQLYLKTSAGFTAIEYTIDESTTDKKISSASAVAYHNGNVYLVYFNSGTKSCAYCYTPIYDSINNTYYLAYRYTVSLPKCVQGFNIFDYKGKTRLVLTVSYGRCESKSFYLSYIYTYTFDENTGAKTLDNVMACPPMVQQSYAKGGLLYLLFENASKPYITYNRDPIDKVYTLKLSKLCDEKKGSVININAANVNDGKKITITSNIKGATLYYSTSTDKIPYISYKKIVDGKAFKTYTKDLSSWIYAVAVVDGRVVASDAVYYSVPTIKGPSSLKIQAKSAKAVNLKWNKVSGVKGYYIYRSDKKNGTYKKIATVATNTNFFKDKTVKKNTTYYYKVKAYRVGYKNSDFSNIISVKTKKS